ncbi:MAG: hypothetical protein AB1689_13945 [Thermodesulfobacteriota bacterium]
MSNQIRRVGAATLAILAWTVAAEATIVGGGGPRFTDCFSVFDTPVALTGNARHIRCFDGDPSCDADGEVNGECRFPVAVCANSSDASNPYCTPVGVDSIFVDHSLDNGDPKFDPDFQALQSRIENQIDPPTDDVDACTSASNVVVRLKGPFPGNRCRQSSKVIKLRTMSPFVSGRFFTDVDTLRLTCRPAAGSCDPGALFDGTFDRIQKQIFNTSCALSACHDSQTQQAGLLLEVGASYAQLVGATPTNAAAQGLGWLRVTPGDPDLSFLHHKVTGDLGVGLGSRMPLGAPPLAASLVEILRLWIEAGAPETGWVPGTDS